MSHTWKDDSLPEPTLNFSNLLSVQNEIIQGETSVHLEFIHRPKSHWHARTTNCLFKKQCAPLQSTTERQLIVLEVR